MSLASQLMNISSELARTSSLKKKGDAEGAERSFSRALELADLSVVASATASRRRELARLRESIAAAATEDSDLDVTLDDVQQELEPFSGVLARERGVE